EPDVEDVVVAEDGMTRLFIDAGRRDGVRPGDIVGAIANEADVPGRAIGSIDIYDKFTFVEIPHRFKAQVLDRMSRVMLRNRLVSIRVATPGAPPPIDDRRELRRDDRRDDRGSDRGGDRGGDRRDDRAPAS